MADIRDYDDIYEYARDQEIENEQFWGIELDEAKAEKLKRMQKMCIALADMDKDIQNNYFPFDNSNRNGSVQISVPDIYIAIDARVADMLSKLYADADYVCMSVASGRILLSFIVAEMWKSNGTKK